MFLPYGRQTIEDDDIAAVAAALRGDFLTTGPLVDAFEKALCDATGARHAVVCNSGTAALHLAGLALGLGPGDAVIVPSVTFLATANAVRYTGAEIVFSDVDPETGLMGADHLRAALARCDGLGVKPRAVFPVHLTGRCVDLPALRPVADAHDMRIVTDACHALGSVCAGHPAGDCALEDMAAFSFHPVKAVAMGEGGAVTTNDAAWVDAMRRFRSHGMARREDIGPWAYDMPEPGYNYRAPDILCALGLSQMKKLDRFVARRRELAARYDRGLAGLAPVLRTPPPLAGCESAWHLYAIALDFAALGMDRAAVMSDLRARGIGTQVHYIPVHRQPYYAARYPGTVLPGADHYYEATLSLPLYPALTDGEADYVIETLKQLAEGKAHDSRRTENRNIR